MMKAKPRNGFTLVATIFIILVIAVLAIITSTFISSDAVLAVRNINSLKAFYISNAGVEYYLKQLQNDSDWTSPPTKETRTFAGGVFAISTTNESASQITFTVTSFLTLEGKTYSRSINLLVTGGSLGGVNGIANQYSIYMGGGVGGGASLGNNATVNGNVYINGNLSMGSGATVTGDATATGSISGGTVQGSKESGAPPPPNPPTLEVTYYTNQINYANTNPTVVGTYAVPSSLSPGTVYVRGDVTINNNVTLTGVSTIVATGTVTTGSNITIGNNLTIIAGGQITMVNAVTIGAKGLWYSATGILFKNTGTVSDVNVGDGSAFITPGDIIAKNNLNFSGFIYAGGTLSIKNNMTFSGLMVAKTLDVGNNSNLTVNPSSMDFNAIPGISGGTAGTSSGSMGISGWGEIY